ncbi:MAG: hypothetical protein KC635_05820, partial [Myxococcales bacterium]|nr:hypothetical protein [Myxococcales bacterium]
MTREPTLPARLRAAALAAATALLVACPSAPDKLSEPEFAARGDTLGDGVGATCTPECGGLIESSAWWTAPGWRFSGGATPVTTNGRAFILDGSGDEAAAVMLGRLWGGGFELRVTLEVVDPGGAGGLIAFGAWEDEAAATSRATAGAAIATATSTVSAAVSTTGSLGATDGVPIDAGSPVTITLTAACDAVSVAVEGGGTARKTLARELPKVDAVFLRARGGAVARVTSLALVTACGGQTPPQCLATQCVDDDAADCLVKTCTALGACAPLPAAAGTGCDDGDACSVAAACDDAGVCVGVPMDCADDDPCTLDTCVDGTCRREPAAAPASPAELASTSALASAGLDTRPGVDGGFAWVFGAGDFVALDNPATGAGSLSVSSWVWVDALPPAGGQADIFSQALTTGSQYWYCGLDSDGHAVFGAGTARVVGSTILPVHRWSHLTCAYDAATDELRVFVYTEPVAGGTGALLDGAAAAGGQFHARTGPSDKLLVGSRGLDVNQFRGALDGVRVWRAPILASASCTGDGCQVPLCVGGVGCFPEGRGDGGCDDGESCTTDVCLPFADPAGCRNEVADDGAACEDGSGCTEGDTCRDGVCQPGVVCAPADLCDLRECAGDVCVSATKQCAHVDECATGERCDGASGQCLASYIEGCFRAESGWRGRVELAPLEPAAEIGAGGIGPATSLDGSDRSTFARQGEPVEVPLWRGFAGDESVVAYFDMESVVTIPGRGSQTLVGVPDQSGATRVLGIVQGSGLEPTVTPEAGRFGSGYANHRPAGTRFEALPGSITLAAWLRFSGAPADSQTLGWAELALAVVDGSWEVRVDGVAAFSFPVGDGWHHVAIVYDDGAHEVTAYRDGLVAGSAPAALSIASGQFDFGESGSTPPPLAPDLDELLIMSRALSAEEVRNLARAGVAAFGSVVPSGVSLQIDYDDVMVERADPVTGPRVIAHEVVGRRPHSDSGAGLDGVLGYWRFTSGSLAATAFVGSEKVSAAAVGVVGDPFGAATGAVTLASATAVLAGPDTTHPRAWSFVAPFTVELWVRTTDDRGCGGVLGGPVIMQAVNGLGETGIGWSLRVCGGVLRFDQVDTTHAASVSGARGVADGAWHHVMAVATDERLQLVLDGVVDGTADVSGEAVFAGTTNGATLTYARLDDGQSSALMTDTAVDEVLFHSVARTPGYAWARVHPVTPTVRFFVDTVDGAGSHVLPHYAIYLGNPTATATAPADGCDQLLSPCNGWLAWWRFDEVSAGGTTPDSASSGVHLVLGDGELVAAGVDGPALALDGTQTTPLVATWDAPALDTATWHVEAAVRPTAGATHDAVVATRAVGSDVVLQLALDTLGRASTAYTPVGRVNAVSASAAGVINGAWSAVGGGLDDAALTVYTATATGSVGRTDPVVTGAGL